MLEGKGDNIRMFLQTATLHSNVIHSPFYNATNLASVPAAYRHFNLESICTGIAGGISLERGFQRFVVNLTLMAV